MSAVTDAWRELLAVHDEVVGPITATIDGIAASKPCIPTDSPWNRVHAEGGGGEEWDEERELQMLVTDLTADSTDITLDSTLITADRARLNFRRYAVVIMSDDVRPARLEHWRINNGVAYLTVKFQGIGYTADSTRITADTTLITVDAN